MENGDFNLLLHAIMYNCCVDMPTFDRLRVGHFVAKHYKVCNLPLVHKRMFYIRVNLRMLQHSNVECNIRMFVLCNKMMYFGGFVVLAA